VSIRRPKSEVNMGLDLPPFNGLRLFEAAARCGSFKRAAQELNLTSGASHGIASLEEWLGVELFDRSRGPAPTPAGHRYLPYVKEALSMIAKGTSETLARSGVGCAAAAAAVGFITRTELPIDKR
jgi:LysR family transcriptional regulator, glycine cleavage system transcriptional activator